MLVLYIIFPPPGYFKPLRYEASYWCGPSLLVSGSAGLSGILCVRVGFVSRQKFSVVVIVEGGSGYIKGA